LGIRVRAVRADSQITVITKKCGPSALVERFWGGEAIRQRDGERIADK
jgi:hypothetical protein